MQIPEELLTRWKQLRSYGDNEGIIALLEKPMKKTVLISYISRCFKDKVCSDNVFKALETFYREKEERLFPNKPSKK